MQLFYLLSLSLITWSQARPLNLTVDSEHKESVNEIMNELSGLPDMTDLEVQLHNNTDRSPLELSTDTAILAEMAQNIGRQAQQQFEIFTKDPEKWRNGLWNIGDVATAATNGPDAPVEPSTPKQPVSLPPVPVTSDLPAPVETTTTTEATTTSESTTTEASTVAETTTTEATTPVATESTTVESTATTTTEATTTSAATDSTTTEATIVAETTTTVEVADGDQTETTPAGQETSDEDGAGGAEVVDETTTVIDQETDDENDTEGKQETTLADDGAGGGEIVTESTPAADNEDPTEITTTGASATESTTPGQEIAQDGNDDQSETDVDLPPTGDATNPDSSVKAPGSVPDKFPINTGARKSEVSTKPTSGLPQPKILVSYDKTTKSGQPIQPPTIQA